MKRGTFKRSKETLLKMSIAQKNRIGHDIIGEKNGKWKGNSVGYVGVHTWINKELGKPKKCENCGTTSAKKYEWANISGKYLRDLSDWARLCSRCHQLIDDTGLFMNSGNRKS